MKSNSCHKASTAACKVCLGQTKQDLEILLSNQTSFGNLTVKPNKFWKFYCQTKQVLEILLSNQTSFGSFTVKPNKFWKFYCQTKQVLEILLSNQTSFGNFTVKPNKFWKFYCETKFWKLYCETMWSQTRLRNPNPDMFWSSNFYQTSIFTVWEKSISRPMQ